MKRVGLFLLLLGTVGWGMAQPAFEPRSTLPVGPMYDAEFSGDTVGPGRKDTLLVAEGSGVWIYVWDSVQVKYKKFAYLPKTSVDRAQAMVYDRARRLLFLSTDRALEVWSLVNMASPTLLSRVNYPSTSPYFTVLGWDSTRGILVVGIPFYGLLFLDMSQPSSPVLLGTAPLSAMILQLALAGNLVYVAAEFDGLIPVDYTDPSNPVVGTPVNTGGAVTSVDADPSRNLLAVADPISQYVFLYDLTMTLLGSFGGSALIPAYLALWGSLLFVTDDAGSLRRVDVSDPTQPVETGRLTTDYLHPPRRVEVVDPDRVLMTQADLLGLMHVDFSVDPFNPQVHPVASTRGFLQGGSAVQTASFEIQVVTVVEEGEGPAGVQGDAVHVNPYQAGVFFKDPAVLLDGRGCTMDHEIAFHWGFKQPFPLKVLLARAVNVPWHLAVVTVDSAQVSVDTLGLPGYPISVEGNLTYAYVGDNNGNLYVVNHATSPMTLVHTVPVPTRFIMDMDLQDTLLAMALSDSGLALYALGDSVNLQLETHLSGHPVDNVRLRDSLLFALGGSSGAYDVRIYRIQAGTLTLLSQLTDPYTRYLDADRAGNVLFVVQRGTYGALQAYDISDPTQPVWLASVDLPSVPRNVRAFPDGTVMVWTQETGVHAFHFPYVGVGESRPPVRRFRVQAGRRVLRLILDRPGRVRVFDALGREVVRRWVPASGTLALPLRPGLYFWHLDMEGGRHERGRIWVMP